MADLGGSGANAPYCFTKLVNIRGYTNVFYEYDCSTAAGRETIYDTYTQDSGPNQQVTYTTIVNVVQTTPQGNNVATTSPGK
jgi:hypothetical protein